MKRYRLYKIYLVIMVLSICHESWAQETKLSKSIDKSFDVSDHLTLEITNKYGSVIVDTWPRNEVALRIEILAYGKDENAAEKLMDRVEFDFKQSSDFLEIESVFDRKKSFFNDLINAVGDYSASLLSNHKLQVNYELTIPETTTSVSIENRFGDIYLGIVPGRLNIGLAHGNLQADALKDYSRLNVNYGKIKINEIGEASISLKGAELELENIAKLKLNSSSSSIIAKHVFVADIESTNDKIDINEVREISGSANFTELSIGNLVEICRLSQSYGGIRIKNINENFQSIRLDGKNTDYELNFSKRSNFEARIYARDDKLNITEFPGVREKRYLDDKSKFVQVTGAFGDNPKESKLDIDAQNGEVTIDFIQAPPETYNK